MQRPDTLTRLGRFLAACALGAILLWFLYKIRVVLFILLGAGALAYALDPLAQRFSAGRPRLRPLGIALAYVTVFAALGLAGVFGLRPVANDLRSLIATLPASVERLDAWWATTSARLREALPPSLKAQLEHRTSDIASRAQSLASSLALFLASIVALGQSFVNLMTEAALAFVISVFMLGDKAFFRRQLLRVIPTAFQTDSDALIGQIDVVLAAYVRGQIVIAAVVGGIATLGLHLMGVKYNVIIGLFTAVTQLIPMVGGALGLIAAVALAGLQSLTLALGVFVLYMVLYQISGNVLGPWVMGNAVKLPPLVVLLATMVGTVLGGVVGLLLSVPATAVLKVIWNYFYPRLATQWRLGPSQDRPAPAMASEPGADLTRSAHWRG